MLICLTGASRSETERRPSWGSLNSLVPPLWVPSCLFTNSEYSLGVAWGQEISTARALLKSSPWFFLIFITSTWPLYSDYSARKDLILDQDRPLSCLTNSSLPTQADCIRLLPKLTCPLPISISCIAPGQVSHQPHPDHFTGSSTLFLFSDTHSS